MAGELDTGADTGTADVMTSMVDSLSTEMGFGQTTDPVDELEDTLEGSGDVAKEPAAPAPAPTSAPAPAPTAGPSSAPGPQPVDLAKPPGSWTAQSQQLWAGLPEGVRAEVHKREQDMFRGLEQYKGAASFAKDVHQSLEMVRPLLAGRVTPTQFISTMAEVHASLSNGSKPVAERASIASALLRTYGLTPEDLGMTQGAQAREPEYVDPEVLRLRQQYQDLQNRLNARDNADAQSVRNSLSAQVDAFAADPKNQYFAEVADDIVLLLRGSGGKMPLQEAYDKAVHANPVTRQREFERLTAERLAEQRKMEKVRAGKAKSATAANVSTSRHQGSTAAAKGSMDDTMEETLRAIESRGS